LYETHDVWIVRDTGQTVVEEGGEATARGFLSKLGQ